MPQSRSINFALAARHRSADVESTRSGPISVLGRLGLEECSGNASGSLGVGAPKSTVIERGRTMARLIRRSLASSIDSTK